MPIELVDFNNHPALDPEVGHIKKVLYRSDSYHVWLHVDEPGTRGPMHKHTADQTFFCLKGECAVHLIDGTKKKLTPGRIIIIPMGELYQLENTGAGPMVLLGNRGEAFENPRFDATGQPVVTREPGSEHS